MHIPDGFLDAKTWVTMSGISAVAVAVAVRKTSSVFEEKQIPLMGVTAAFIFAAQMINFPVAGGTSGHFMGGALAAILLGPFTGIMIMTALLLVQCLVFQDGGITTFGANLFNMGVVGTAGGYSVYSLLMHCGKGDIRKRRLAAAAIAGWFSIVAASAACSIELAVSGMVPLKSI
jgi:cobalt/nickel transport system permease protein